MTDPNRRLGLGKLDLELLRGILQKYTILDPQVILGPRIGEDAAVIDLGGETDHYWVVTSDPVTFTTEEIGYYGVVVNLNDIATRGATPRWFLATLLFPEGTTSGDIEIVFRQIHDACLHFNISWVGGHTEITPGIERVILSGHMIGEVKKEKLVLTGGARAGDHLVLVKGICIEGTSIMAREKGKELSAQGVPPSLIEKGRNFIYEPGIAVLQAARIACDSVPVHAMHDPTEGGLLNGVLEMALASEKTIELDLEKIDIYEESRLFCRIFGLDPLGVIASGALILALAPSDLPVLKRVFDSASIPFRVIGRVEEGAAKVLGRDEKGVRELQPFARDEILKIF